MDMLTLAMAKSYTDSQRLAHSTKEVKVLRETHNGVCWDTPIPVVAGKTYIVTIDSGIFTSVAKDDESGNVFLNCFSDKGELVLSYVEFQPIDYAEIAIYGGKTFIVSEEVETIHPIDPKYLPGEVKPNVIDLTQYNAVDEGGVSCSFNDVVLDLFAKGGGNSELQHDGSFWQDVSRGGNMRIMIDAADVNGLVIEIKPGSLVRYADGTLNAVEISMILSTVDYWARVTVIFANDIVNDKTKVFVFTEPV